MFQILSVSVGPCIQHTSALSPVTDTMTLQSPTHSVSVESMPNPLLSNRSQNAVPPVSLYGQPMSLYSQPQNTLPPVTLYSQSVSPIPVYSQSETITPLYSSFSISNTSSAANLTDQPTCCNTGVVMPAHYFDQEIGVSWVLVSSDWTQLYYHGSSSFVVPYWKKLNGRHPAVFV